MATHSSILARRIPWTEESGRLQSIQPHRVGYDWSNLACTSLLTLPHFVFLVKGTIKFSPTLSPCSFCSLMNPGSPLHAPAWCIAPSYWELWMTHCGGHLLICWPHHTWKTIKSAFQTLPWISDIAVGILWMPDKAIFMNVLGPGAENVCCEILFCFCSESVNEHQSYLSCKDGIAIDNDGWDSVLFIRFFFLLDFYFIEGLPWWLR